MKQFLLEYFKKTDVEFIENFQISTISKIGIGSTVSYAVWPKNEMELVDLIRFLFQNEINYKIVGALSNILPKDEHHRCVLIVTTKLNGYKISDSKITAQCGAYFSKLILYAANYNLGGLESLVGIPGTVGGMVVMNAGAYGSEISDFTQCVTVFSPEDDVIRNLPCEELCFSYRKSKLKGSNFVLLNADFNFFRKEKNKIKSDLNKIIFKRKCTQPTDKKSLGSVFKRKDGIQISKLIDELGFKGFKVGGASISEKHAGFIINSGGATAQDVKIIIKTVKEKIFETYGILAEEEIEIL